MITSSVHSEEQSNIRFRKTSQTGCNTSSDEDVNPEKFSNEEGEPDKLVSKALERYNLTPEDERTIEYMKGVYKASLEMINFSEDNSLLWDKVFRKEVNQNYSAVEMNSLVTTLIKKNIFFMEANCFFKMLPHGDRRKLLSKNMPEMCQLRGALRFDVNQKNFRWYFNSTDRGLMKEQQPTKAVIEEGDLGAFYSSKEAARNIITNVDSIAAAEMPTEVILMMMHVVIFSSDEVSIERPDIATEAQIFYLTLIHRYLYNKLPVVDASKNMSKVMAVLVELRECGEKTANLKFNSKSVLSPRGPSNQTKVT